MRELPIFPLPLVLNPGGELRLRIFEPRYLDMVRDCARSQTGFGVCSVLPTPGSDQRGICSMGCEAKIVDFDTLPDGLLGIQVIGLERFRIQKLQTRNDGLSIASIDDIPAEPMLVVPAEYGLLSDIVAGVMGEDKSQPLGQDQLDNASWVGFRLSEVLPLELPERQQLIELTDPIERLRLLSEWLPRFQRSDEDEA
jgi:Lon protease-like protein